MKSLVIPICLVILGGGCVANQSEMSAGFAAVQEKIEQEATEIKNTTQVGVAAIQQQAGEIQSKVQQGIVNIEKTDNRTYDPIKDYLVYIGFVLIAVVLLTYPVGKALFPGMKKVLAVTLGAVTRRGSG